MRILTFQGDIDKIQWWAILASLLNMDDFSHREQMKTDKMWSRVNDYYYRWLKLCKGGRRLRYLLLMMTTILFLVPKSKRMTLIPQFPMAILYQVHKNHFEFGNRIASPDCYSSWSFVRETVKICNYQEINNISENFNCTTNVPWHYC